MASQRGDDTGDPNDIGDSEQRRFNASPQKRTRRAPPPLLDEIVAEILSWVPVKSLLRFKCVSKSWKTLISDPHFVKTHLQRSTMDCDYTHHRLVPEAYYLRDNVVTCSVQSLFNNPSSIHENHGYPLKPEYEIVGSCNGLLCLVCDVERRSVKRVRLWNPSTRLWSKKSPPLYNYCGPLQYHETVFGFGYDKLNDIYKVVSVFCDGSANPTVKVHSLGTNSWRTVRSFPAVPSDQWRKAGEFVSGTLNWLARFEDSNAEASVAEDSEDSEDSDAGVLFDNDQFDVFYDIQYVIISFDLESETSKELLLPHDLDVNCLAATTLGILRDCLCVSQDYSHNHFVLWQMMEYGVKDSWVKLMSISYPDFDRDFVSLEPLCMSKKGDIIMVTGFADGVVLYNPRDRSFRRHGIQSNKIWFRSMVYVESLVSPSR